MIGPDFVAGILVGVPLGLAIACSGPVVEKPPCDEATLARIIAECPDEATCDKRLDERQALCAKRIKDGE